MNYNLHSTYDYMLSYHACLDTIVSNEYITYIIGRRYQTPVYWDIPYMGFLKTEMNIDKIE